MMKSEWIKVYCRFCNQPIEGWKVLPPGCMCEGYLQAREEWVEKQKEDPDYEPPLSEEEYNNKYPVTYSGERIVQDKDSMHKLCLEARQFDDGKGLCVWVPFENSNAGLCWDMSEGDAQALYELLGEYLKEK